ncbi:hypothetical protein TNCV_160351 [Trichonephila clavipes]|nr:hypothetical protein TNCV_160351 [Trichonephila clavipes]
MATGSYMTPTYSRSQIGRALWVLWNLTETERIKRLCPDCSVGMTFESGRKVFQTCSKCHLLPTYPEHILDCLGLTLEDVHASPLLVLDFARVNGLMDLI